MYIYFNCDNFIINILKIEIKFTFFAFCLIFIIIREEKNNKIKKNKAI